MICLDTNYLIRALVPDTQEALAVEGWLRSGVRLSISSIAWYEFLCGSTDEEARLAIVLLMGGILPFTEAESQIAASGFRGTNKLRRLRVDAMIAATAIAAGAPLATNNRGDFTPFTKYGLELV